MDRRERAGQGHGVDDLRRDRRARLVLDRLHPGRRISSRIFTEPLLTDGWSGVLKAIPFAIWWLVIIESVALAAEEAHEPHRSIPRGLTLAQLTLIVLVVLTWFFAVGRRQRLQEDRRRRTMLFPLPFVYREVWPEAASCAARDRVLGAGDCAAWWPATTG